jgi:hypothetical protein
VSKHVTRDDFKRILGELDEPTIIELLEVGPSLEELQEAAMCLSGDQDVLAKSGHHVSSKANQVIEIISATEEQDASARR